MKKLLIAAAVLAASYYLYNQSGSGAGVYTDDGTPRTIFFATDQCGDACNQMRHYLKRRVEFEEYDAFDGGLGSELYKKYGGVGFLPYVVMGRQRVTGPDRGAVISSVAAEFGLAKVKKNERAALERNFDSSGDARVVMYATDWCGYCEEARRYFRDNGIPYVELDIEKDRSARRDFDALLGSGTPLLYHGYARMSGFNKREIDSRLNL